MISCDEYETLIFSKDVFNEYLQQSLKIVRDFIIKEELILTGGMAIDLALREKGDKIYADDALPDYDFYSPDFHKCAYKLGKILCDAGMPNVSVIGAFHPTTMRVRIEYTTVADITYIPKDIYDSIPTMQTHDRLKYEHPVFKFMDIHLSLSYPFKNPPLEVIMHRWEKDITRFDILYKHYKITPDQIKEPTFLPTKTKLKKKHCLCGFSGLAYWLYKKTNHYIVEASKVPAFSIITNYPDDFQEEKTKYAELLDNVPQRWETIISGIKMEILNNDGNLLSAYYDKKHKIHIANPQFIMNQFLAMFFMYKLDENDKKLCLWGYKKLEMLISNSNTKDSPEVFPSISVYGNNNISQTYTISRDNELIALGEEKKPETPVKPINIYPKEENNCEIPEKINNFEIGKSWVFNVDGTKED